MGSVYSINTVSENEVDAKACNVTKKPVSENEVDAEACNVTKNHVSENEVDAEACNVTKKPVSENEVDAEACNVTKNPMSENEVDAKACYVTKNLVSENEVDAKLCYITKNPMSENEVDAKACYVTKNPMSENEVDAKACYVTKNPVSENEVDAKLCFVTKNPMSENEVDAKACNVTKKSVSDKEVDAKACNITTNPLSVNEIDATKSDITEVETAITQTNEPPDDSYCLRPVDNLNNKVYILNDNEVKERRLGRSEDNANFVLYEDSVANLHLILTRVCDSWVISKDSALKSPHFVEVNGQELIRSRVLEEGDEVSLGSTEGTRFRYRFEKYQGQDERQYDPGCPNSKCHARLETEFLCEDCVDKDHQRFKKLRDQGAFKKVTYILKPLAERSNNGKITKLHNIRYTCTFYNNSISNYQSIILTFIRGRKGYYARCLHYNLSPGALRINTHYAEEFFVLIKEGDWIEVSFSDTEEDSYWFEFCVEQSEACPDCRDDQLCELCRENKLDKVRWEKDERKKKGDPRYLVSLRNGQNEMDFIRLRGIWVVFANLPGDGVDYVLDLGDECEMRVEFFRGRARRWYASTIKGSFFVNGNEMSAFHSLLDGDVLQFGSPNCSSRRVHLYRYTAVPKEWTFRLDSRLIIASDNLPIVNTNTTRSYRQNCLEEIRLAKLKVKNSREGIKSKYEDCKFFSRSFISDIHDSDLTFDEINMSNYRNECYTHWIRVNNSDCRGSSQKIGVVDNESQFYYLRARILNLQCQNSNNAIKISTNKSRNGIISNHVASFGCDHFRHQMEMASHASVHCQERIFVKNDYNRNFHGEIFVKSRDDKNFVHHVNNNNHYCRDYKQEIVVVNDNAENVFTSIRLANYYSRNYNQKIIIDNINCRNILLEIFMDNKESQKYHIEVQISNVNCHNVMYRIIEHYSVIQTDSREPNFVRLVLSDCGLESDIVTSASGQESNCENAGAVNKIVLSPTSRQFRGAYAIYLRWYLRRLPLSFAELATTDNTNVEIPGLFPLAQVGDSTAQQMSALMEYLRENHPHIIIENKGTVYGCMLSSGTVTVDASQSGLINSEQKTLPIEN